MYAECDGPATAVAQHDYGVGDGDEGGNQHEPAKDVRRSVSQGTNPLARERAARGTERAALAALTN
jgi:hypothetical protein